MNDRALQHHHYTAATDTISVGKVGGALDARTFNLLALLVAK